jgi:cyanophycinase
MPLLKDLSPTRGLHRRRFLLGALVGLGAPRHVLGQPAPRSAGPPNGTLLIIGGGSIGPEIGDAARRLSGGANARWVYIPTAVDNVAGAVPPAKVIAPGATVTTLHTRDRKIADSDVFVAPLLSATAVYFGGGRQWRLVDAYGGTRTEREIRAVLDRGGLIAGSSAGATIQGSYLVRGSPKGNDIMMAPGHERGFGYLQNAAIDQHVVARGRVNDMEQVVATHPGLLGIAIDEGTAALIEKNTLTVLGRSVILITDGERHDGKSYYTLPAGRRFDLATWTIIGP